MAVAPSPSQRGPGDRRISGRRPGAPGHRSLRSGAVHGPPPPPAGPGSGHGGVEIGAARSRNPLGDRSNARRSLRPLVGLPAASPPRVPPVAGAAVAERRPPPPTPAQRPSAVTAAL